jgi:hypothetical protein
MTGYFSWIVCRDFKHTFGTMTLDGNSIGGGMLSLLTDGM